MPRPRNFRGSRRPVATVRGALLALLLPGVVGVLAACGDDPFAFDWTSRPDTIRLFSLDRPELNLPSAFSFRTRTTVRVEDPSATGRWDVAVSRVGGEIAFFPPGALNIVTRARIAPFPGADFEDLLEAPADTSLFVANEPVDADVNTTYVIRTTQGFGRCVFFAKMQPLEVDDAGGSVEFVYDANPTCNDRSLVPPDSL